MKNCGILIVGLLCFSIIHTTLGYSIEAESYVPQEEYAVKYESRPMANEYPALKLYLAEEAFPAVEEYNVRTRSCRGPNCPMQNRPPPHHHRPCNPLEIKEINKQISLILNGYPIRSPIQMSIDSVFNEEREQLAKAFIHGQVDQVSNCNRAKKKIKNFRIFVNRFNDIRRKILAAMDRLQAINDESSYSTEIQNEALQLTIALTEVDSLHIADRILREYNKFNKSIQSRDIKPTIPATDSNDANKQSVTIKSDDAPSV